MWNWVFILFSAVTLFKFTSSQPRVCLYQDLINNVAINM